MRKSIQFLVFFPFVAGWLSGCFSPEGSLKENGDKMNAAFDGIRPSGELPEVVLDFEAAKEAALKNSLIVARARESLRLARLANERIVVGHAPVVSASAGVERMIGALSKGENPQYAIGAAVSPLNLIGENVAWYTNKVNLAVAEINYQYACRSLVAELRSWFYRTKELNDRRVWHRFLGPAAFSFSSSSTSLVGNNSYLADFEIDQEDSAIADGLGRLFNDFHHRYKLKISTMPEIPEVAEHMGKLKARLLGAQLEGLWLKKFGAYVPLIPEVSMSLATPTLYDNVSGGYRAPWKNSTVSLNAGASYGLTRLYDIKDAEIDERLSSQELMLQVQSDARQRLALRKSVKAVVREQAQLKYDLQETEKKVQFKPDLSALLEVQTILARRDSLRQQRDSLLTQAWLENDDAWPVFE